MSDFLNQVKNFFLTAYDYVTTHLSTEALIYIGIAIVLLLLVWIISRSMKRRKADKRLGELEVEVNEIRNNSLKYKFNKAQAFARVNDDITDRFKNLTPKYEICQKSIASCNGLYDQADEYLDRGKYKKAMRTMDELETLLDDTRERIRIVTQSLDHILARETEVREKSNALKERFRQVKGIYTANRADYFSGASYMDEQITDIENEFNAFEEWMFASEFNKAREQIDRISAKTDNLAELVGSYPELYKKAKQLLPAAMNEVGIQTEGMDEAGIDYSVLDVDNKREAITNALSDAIIKLDNGNVKGATNALESISDQILALQEDLSQEKNAYDEIHGGLESNFALVDEVEKELDEIVSLYAIIKDRFGLEDWTRRFEAAREQLVALKTERSQIQEKLAQESTPQMDVIRSYRSFAKRTGSFTKQVREMKRMLVGASSDESRARKQIIKLQLILNEVRLNTVSKQLPSISGQFSADLEEGEKKIRTVNKILNHSPLDVATLNSSLQDAIDFVYRLYNNANNLVGVAVMVENAIVFGNRYRSSYPILDSDLTRAEVCFQNGEYTRALKIAIQAIENLHPGIYEKLVARKDPAVMNLAQ